MPNKKIVCIIQARIGSTRLPGKVMMDLCGKPVLERVVNAVKCVNLLTGEKLIDDIVVATTINTEDTVIAQWCKKNKVKCFRGPEKDVLKRHYLCAIREKADWIVRVTADCPLINPKNIWGLLKSPELEYRALGVNSHYFPLGDDCEVFSFSVLKTAHENAASGYEREHVTPWIRSWQVGKEKEDLADLGTDFNFKGMKLDLDTAADMRRIKKIYERLL